MSRQTLEKLWRKRIDDCAKSGKTVVDWCYYNKVSVHQYYYWKRRLAPQPPQPTPQPPLIPVDILHPAQATLPPTPAGLTLRIAGTAIDLTPGFDPVLLRAVVSALSGLPC